MLSGPSSRSAMEIELNKLSSPRIFLVRMVVFLMLCGLWPNDAAAPHQPLVPTQPSRRKRSKEPKPFAGLTQRPPCALCEREATHTHEPPPAPPEPMPPTTRRPRSAA